MEVAALLVGGVRAGETIYLDPNIIDYVDVPEQQFTSMMDIHLLHQSPVKRYWFKHVVIDGKSFYFLHPNQTIELSELFTEIIGHYSPKQKG